MERERGEFASVERTACAIAEAFGDQDPLLAVMALRLAAQKIYDQRCVKQALPEDADGAGGAASAASA